MWPCLKLARVLRKQRLVGSLVRLKSGEDAEHSHVVIGRARIPLHGVWTWTRSRLVSAPPMPRSCSVEQLSLANKLPFLSIGEFSCVW